MLTLLCRGTIFIKCIHWTRLSTLIYIGQCLLYYVGAQYLLSVFTETDYLPWFTLVNAYFYYVGAQYVLSVFTEPDLSTMIYNGQCLLLYYVGAQYLLSVFTEPDYLPWFTMVNAYYLLCTEHDYLLWFTNAYCTVGAQYLLRAQYYKVGVLSVFTEPDYLQWFTLVNAYFTM